MRFRQKRNYSEQMQAKRLRSRLLSARLITPSSSPSSHPVSFTGTEGASEELFPVCMFYQTLWPEANLRSLSSL